MHWVILRALSRELGFDGMMAAIASRNLPHTLVRKPPMAPYLVGDTGDDPITLDIEGPVFVVGSTSMNEVSIAHGWNPGYIDAPDFHECLAHWGERMLNADSWTGRLADAAIPKGETRFVRPVEDIKNFAGRLHDARTFADWRDPILAIKGPATIDGDTMIQLASEKEIWSEYRCLMIGGRYVTGSRYKTGETVAYSPDVGNRIIAYAEECADIWTPRRAITFDIADTPEGLRIIETNSICSAGFYASDMDRFVGAIEEEFA